MTKYIDKEKIGLTDFEIVMCNGSYKEALKMLLKKIENMPFADVVKVVKCKDCNYYIPYEWMFDGRIRSSNINDYSLDEIGCSVNDRNYPPDGFCSFGERRTDE